MVRYFIRLAFNGTRYHGWQVQDNAITVQGVLTDALSKLLHGPVELTGCGRTDTGVHAEEFYVHFETEKAISKASCDKLAAKLNVFLPADIGISSVFPVPEDAHARFSATQRTYQYRIAKTKDPFLAEFAWKYTVPLDIGMMNKGAELLMKYTDFSCFSRTHTQVKTNNCRISFAQWEEKDGMLLFTISADRFLRNMVRAIVGTLVEMGRGKIGEKELKQIILSKNRSNAGKSVPACGLFLVKVEYPENMLAAQPEKKI